MSSPSTSAPAAEAADRPEPGTVRKALVFGTVGLGLLMGMIDQTAVATALPAMQADLGTSLAWVAWTISGYGLGQIVAMPIAGRLSDQFGRRRVFLLAVAVFTVASLVAGTAESVGVLIAVRVAQGAAAGSLLPSATGIVAETFGRNRDRAVALFSTVFPIGAVLGPVVGALLMAASGWRAVFSVNVPLGAAVLVLGLLLVPRSTTLRGQRVDLAGAGLLALTVLAATMAISLGSALGGLGGLGLAVVLALVGLLAGTVLTRHLRRSPSPLVPPQLLRGRTFRSLNVANLLFGATAIAQSALIPAYAHLRYGIDPVVAAGILTLRAVGMIVASSVSVAVIRRFGFRPLLAGGALVIVAGLLLFAVPPPPGVSVEVWLAVATTLSGLGMGFNAPASSNAGLHLAPDQVSAVSGLRGMFRQSGGIVGIVAVTAAASAAADPGLAQAWAHGVLAAVLALGVVLMLRIPNHRGAW